MNDTTARTHPAQDVSFLMGGGDLGARMRTHDWAATPLAAPESWPQPLKTLVGVMLAAGQPMFVAWGPERLLLYNDAYAALLADRHPAALGRPFLEVWSEIREEITPLFTKVFAGEPVHMDDIELHLDRPGRPREAHFAFSYTPVRDEHGTVAGLFCPCTETTEQVFARRREQAEAERQRVLFQQMPGFVAVLAGPGHIYEYVNGAYVAVSGARDFLGRSIREVFPEFEGQGIFEQLDQVYATGEPFMARALPIRLAGEAGERFIDLLYQPIRDETGVKGIFVGGHDVTDLVRSAKRRDVLLKLDERLRDVPDPAELSFAASELLGQALGACRVGYGTFDPVARTISVERNWSTPGFGSVAGLHRFSDYGSYVDDLLRGDPVANADVETDRRTMGGVDAFRAIGVRAFLDMPVVEHGQTAAMMFVHSPVPRTWTDEEAALVHDVAERTRVAVERARGELALRDTASRLRDLNETLEARVAERTAERDRVWQLSQDLLGVADSQGRWLSVNPAWTRLLGWSEAEITGRTSEWLEHPDDREQTRVEVAHLAEGSKTLAFGNRFRHRDGSYRWLSWTAVPEGGQLFCNARDVTSEKERQAELDAAQEALRQSQKMEAVGQLTGGIAHDFNNLLTGIVGSLELLQRRAAEGRFDQVGRFADVAVTAAQRAATLTQRLLAFSRRQPLDPKPVEANRLVASMEELLRRTLGPFVNLELVFAGALWPTLCDPNQLENAILNLAINARDAMPGGGRLTIETANAHLDAAYARTHGGEVEPGQYVVVAVTDTGTGIPHDQLDRIFEPFFTTKPIGKGTGLGLSQLYGFARQSGGHVNVCSEEGQGTTFRLYLPRHRGPLSEDAEAEAGQPGRAAMGETVLIVDDEAAIRMLIAETLEELGYGALEAGDGPAGLEMLQTDQRVDLLVTDVGLPGLNGRQLADAARVLRPNLKVLFITGYAGTAAVGNGVLEHGMEILPKPFAMDQLANKIREIMERA